MSIRYQFRPAATGTSVDACTATSSPLTCTGDTRLAPDGLYDMRAIVTDGAGFGTTSATISGRIDKTAPPTATLTNSGSPLSGSVALSGTASDAGSDIASVRVEYAPAGTTTWAEACADTTAPYSCSWATVGIADGLYDLRSVASDLAGNTLYPTVVASRRVDDNGPALTLNDLLLRADRTDAAGATFAAGAVLSGNRVTITLGAPQSGNSKLYAKTLAMTWTPSSVATDLAGNACANTAVSESSPSGKDF